jgi:hypothetical protein
MPRKPINYANTIIYKLVCNDLSIKSCYVGHTTDITNRKSCHKKVCINDKYKDHDLKVYQIIRENGGFLNWQLIEIEKFPCADAMEARIREREWYEKLNSELNSRYPQINKGEWQEINKEHIAIKHKKYYEDNKEKLKEKEKKYRISHIEEIREREKNYRISHKEEIKEKNKKTFLCGCGKELTLKKKSRHYLSFFHQQFITNTKPA